MVVGWNGVIRSATDIGWIDDVLGITDRDGEVTGGREILEDRCVRIGDVAGVFNGAAIGTDHPVAEVAVDSIHQLDVEIGDLSGIALAAIVGSRNMAPNAECTGLVGVLVGDGESGMEDGVPG